MSAESSLMCKSNSKRFSISFLLVRNRYFDEKISFNNSLSGYPTASLSGFPTASFSGNAKQKAPQNWTRVDQQMNELSSVACCRHHVPRLDVHKHI